MLPEVTNKALNIPPFIVMEVLERARELESQGKNIIHMEIGEPDFDTPSSVIEAGIKALKDGKTHYTHSLGILPLRETICEEYADKYGVSIHPDQIIITSGTSPALLMIFAALLDAGDEIILANPYYPCYASMIRFLGATPRFIPVTPENSFHMTASEAAAAITKNTKAILINSPANPTGMCMASETMKAIADLDIPVISDEIYHDIRYEGTDHSMLEYTDNTLILNGFSKRYAMTGWRLGYLIAPPILIRTLQKIQQSFFISASGFTQWAGITAIKEAVPTIRKMVETYRKRRDYLYNALRKLGFIIHRPPEGAFYLFADCRKFSKDAYKFTFDILENAYVGITPGIDFGSMGEGFVRFSYANSLENLREGVNRIEHYLKTR